MPDPLKQLRDRHPMATLTSELLMLHEAQFVVKVVVQTQEGGVATGLAADTQIEIAEDRARHRALLGLGLGMSEAMPGSLLATKVSSSPLAAAQASPPQENDSVMSIVSSALPPLPVATAPLDAPAASAYLGNVSPRDGHTAVPVAQMDPAPSDPGGTTQKDSGPQQSATKPTLAKVKPQKPKPEPSQEANADPLPSSLAEAGELLSHEEISGEAPLPAPVNLSDVIAQTDIELRRLDWSVAEGREYLTQTYNKRSRHDLTDEELLTFLLYLESLPTPQGTLEAE